MSQTNFDLYADSCGTDAAAMKTNFGYIVAYILELTTMGDDVTTSDPTDASNSLMLLLEAAFDDYDTEQTDFMSDINTFTSDTSATLAIVTDPDTGLVSDINCIGPGDSMDNIYDVLCVAFIPALFETSIIIACGSCFMFLAMFFLFFASIRFKKAAPSGSTNK